MRKVTIEVLNKRISKSIQEASLNTAGRSYDDAKEWTPELFQRYLISEHSPIRSINLRITLHDISYFTSVHFARHGMSTHYVTTSRPDRAGKERSVEQTVNHIIDCNAQALIDMMRKRLCMGKVAKDTFEWALAIKYAMEKHPELVALADCLVVNCIYRCGCSEFTSCGFFTMFAKEAGHYIQYLTNIKSRYNIYNEYIKKIKPVEVETNEAIQM